MAQADQTNVPILNNSRAEWLSKFIKQSMNDIWPEQGLKEQGMNYWTTGASRMWERKWQRFEPNNPLYQSWFEVYVVDNFEFISEWKSPSVKTITQSVGSFFDLAIADQNTWLKKFGIKNLMQKSLKTLLKSLKKKMDSFVFLHL